MDELRKSIWSNLRRAFPNTSESSDTDTDQEGEGVTTRATTKLVQAQSVQDPVQNPSPEPERDVPQVSEPAELMRPEPAEVSQPEPNQAKLLFSDKPIVLQNDEIKLFVVRDYLKRQKVFRLDDHLYQLKAEVKKGKAPLISSILDVLRQALEYVINSLKQDYPAGNLNLLSLKKVF